MHLLNRAKIQSYDSKSLNWHMSQANTLYNYTEYPPQEEKMDITATSLWYKMSRAQRLVRRHLAALLLGGKHISYLQGPQV